MLLINLYGIVPAGWVSDDVNISKPGVHKLFLLWITQIFCGCIWTWLTGSSLLSILS